MNIVVDGAQVSFCGHTLADLLILKQPASPFAVAINGVFVPKQHYAATALHMGDAVEIVHPVVGG